MRVRTYGFLLLLMVGVAPLTMYGVTAVERARTNAEHQIRASHGQVAHAIAGRIAVDTQRQHELITAVGIAVLHARSPRERQLTLDAYLLSNPALHEVLVYDRVGAVIAKRMPDGSPYRGLFSELADNARAGGWAQSGIMTGNTDETPEHSLAIGAALDIVGKRVGTIVARYDLVGMWPAVNSVRVGETGFIRLLSYDGQLLAHGHPEERRWVFDTDADDVRGNAKLVSAALLGRPATNLSRVPVVASLALVRSFPAVVVVEQETTEAFASILSLERSLLFLALLGLAFAILMGMLIGRELVRALELVRRHVESLPNNLKRRLHLQSRLVEVQALAEALDDMAGNLFDEREKAKSRERLTTFARVAAGLAHDLRVPIEAVRGAVELVCMRPNDPKMQNLLQASRKRDLPRLTRFMDDLQRLAHDGNPRLDYESVMPSELAAEVRIELAAAPKWAGVTFEIIGSAARAVIDRNLVRRALLNLAGNGADACLHHRPDGQVTIEVLDGTGDAYGAGTAKHQSDEIIRGDVIVFRVSDTGVGIEPERIESLKHSDFQSTKRTNGVGLGLGVVRQVLNAHGGLMEITSTVGVGSQFTVILPRTPPHEHREA